MVITTILNEKVITHLKKKKNKTDKKWSNAKFFEMLILK